MTSDNKKTVPSDPWEDLVLSILSVNKWNLEKTYGLAGRLRKEGLFDPKNLMESTPSQIAGRLKLGGYDRGEFLTNLFAGRLSSLGEFARRHGYSTCTAILSGKDGRAIERLLTPVKGIGAQVIANFCILREIPRK